MKRAFVRLLPLWLGFTAATLPAIQIVGQHTHAERAPAVAGAFYPAGREDLKDMMSTLFSGASPLQNSGPVQGLIVPHAGYVYSGEVAASGFGSIPEDASYRNVFIIASSHRAQFNGASVYTAGNYRTPLGPVEVNMQVSKELVEKHPHISFIPEAHATEHSIEVQLPFIQSRFGEEIQIVPIVLGSSSIRAARDLARALLPHFKTENLFVVSSDFSHYPGYRDAIRTDSLTALAIMKKNPEAFYNTLRKVSNEPVRNLSTPCCGWSAVMTLLYMAAERPGLSISPVLYRNSGDAPAGDRDRVVGYWSMLLHETTSASAGFVINEKSRRQLLEISRKTLDEYIRYSRVASLEDDGLPGQLQAGGGAFVSLYMGGRLRGCTGRMYDTIPVSRLIQELTVAAATLDSRFAAVEEPELPYIEIEISLLTPLRRIYDIEEFIPGKHGIYMLKDNRSGTYLPQVARKTGWNREELLGHCAREKAGIGWNGWKDAELYIYEALIISEKDTS